MAGQHGLDFPFVLSGSFAVVAGVLNARATTARRDQAVRRAGMRGFLFGVAMYAVGLAIQVGSNL